MNILSDTDLTHGEKVVWASVRSILGQYPDLGAAAKVIGDENVGPTAIARRAGIGKSSCCNILRSLEAKEYIKRAKDGSRKLTHRVTKCDPQASRVTKTDSQGHISLPTGSRKLTRGVTKTDPPHIEEETNKKPTERNGKEQESGRESMSVGDGDEDPGFTMEEVAQQFAHLKAKGMKSQDGSELGFWKSLTPTLEAINFCAYWEGKLWEFEDEFGWVKMDRDNVKIKIGHWLKSARRRFNNAGGAVTPGFGPKRLAPGERPPPMSLITPRVWSADA